MDSRLARIDSLPPMPESCRKLESLLSNPQATGRDVSSLIAEDPALATHVLKLANSAYYAIPGGVDSLHRAVGCLGFSAIRQIVLCMQTYRLLQQSGPPVPRWLIAHGAVVAGLCRHLASEGHRALLPHAYSAGLLHDLGRMALATLMPDALDRYLDAVRKGAVHGLELEHELFGIDHQEVGRELARKWRYPEILVRAVGDHHGPGGAAEDRLGEQQRALSDLICIADAWAAELGRPGLPGVQSVTVDEKRSARADLPPSPPAERREELLQAMNQSME